MAEVFIFPFILTAFRRKQFQRELYSQHTLLSNICIQLIFLDGHVELTNKVPSTFSRLRLSLQWKPVHFSFWSIVKKLRALNKMY